MFEVKLHTFQTSPLADFTHAQDSLRKERNASRTYFGGSRVLFRVFWNWLTYLTATFITIGVFYVNAANKSFLPHHQQYISFRSTVNIPYAWWKLLNKPSACVTPVTIAWEIWWTWELLGQRCKNPERLISPPPSHKYEIRLMSCLWGLELWECSYICGIFVHPCFSSVTSYR
jgi:hypothetical protein